MTTRAEVASPLDGGANEGSVRLGGADKRGVVARQVYDAAKEPVPIVLVMFTGARATARKL